MSSWAMRTAKMSRVCHNCDDHIRPGRRYFYMLDSGAMFCCECPPDGAEEIDICD